MRVRFAARSSPATRLRFLVAENRWEDKLTILPWNEQMASRAGIQVACSVNHVEELVVHWMTTGSVDYPLARTALGSGKWRRPAEPGCRVDLSGVRQIGELAVHRESMERVLAESPQSPAGDSGCAAGGPAAGDGESSRWNFEARRGTRRGVVGGFVGAGILDC